MSEDLARDLLGLRSVALFAAGIEVGDAIAQAVPRDQVAASVRPNQCGRAFGTLPSALVNGAIRIVSPKVGSETLAFYKHDERALVGGVYLPSPLVELVVALSTCAQPKQSGH